MRLTVFGGMRCDGALLGTGEPCLEGAGNFPGDLTFDSEDIGQLAIEVIGPQMGISLRINQLNIHSYLVGRPLHRAFEDVCDAKLLRDLEQISRRALIALRRST